MSNTLAENKNKIFCYHFDLFPETMVTYTMIWDNDFRKKMQILVKILFLFLITIVSHDEAFGNISYNQTFAQIIVFEKSIATFSCHFFIQNMIKDTPHLTELFF